MRVNSIKSFYLLLDRRLDHFRLARELICMKERLAALQQGLTFLRRCKRHTIFPNFMNHAIRLPSGTLQQRRLASIKKDILTSVIRKKYSAIFFTKGQAQKVRSVCPPHVLEQLQPIIDNARLETKKNRKEFHA